MIRERERQSSQATYIYPFSTAVSIVTSQGGSCYKEDLKMVAINDSVVSIIAEGHLYRRNSAQFQVLSFHNFPKLVVCIFGEINL